MEVIEVKQKIEEIKNAIKEKNYKVEYSLPNVVQERTAIDGSEYLMVRGCMDGPKSSAEFGSFEVEIAGINFYQSLEPESYGIESEYFDKIEEMEVDEEEVYKLKETIEELIESLPEYISPYCMSDVDLQAKAYMKMIGRDLPYYYEEGFDEDSPMDEDYFYPIEDVCDEIVEYNGVKYFIAMDYDDEIIGVAEGENPNKYGQYPTVRLIKENGEVIKVEENDEWFNSSNNELEEEKG